MAKDGRLTQAYLAALALLWLLAMHYYQPNGGGAGLALAFNSTSWIAISLILAVGLWQLQQQQTLHYTRTDLALLAVLLCLALPLLWSDAPWRQTGYDRYLGLIALAALILLHRQFVFSRAQKQRFWALLSVAALIQALIALGQFLAIPLLAEIPQLRPSGTLQQTNVIASLLASGIAISAYQRLSLTLPNGLLWLHRAVILTAFTAQLLILSRTGLLGTLLALLGLGLLYRTQRRRLLELGGLFGAALILALLLQHSQVGAGRANMAEPGYRTVQYQLSAELFLQAPLTGHGIGQFQSRYAEHKAQRLAQQPDLTQYSSASSHPHNELLFWAVEGGVLPPLGLVLFALGFTLLVWRRGSLAQRAAWLCSVPILLHTQTEYPLYHSAPHLALLALLLSEATPGTRLSRHAPLTLLPKLTAVLLVLLITPFMLTNLHTTYLGGQYFAEGKAAPLTRIINPFGQEKIVNMLMGSALLKAGHPQALAQAQALAEHEVQLRPSVGAYLLLYDAQRLSGQTQQAQATLAQARYHFPSAPLLQPSEPTPPTRSADWPPASPTL
ncbi:PglL family O-oligosaccharyltransferase [Ferrimonas pelagia]|uniref:Oligosaccharyltransferase n=1 Tax=Ferrimonas pelagia TaxID=1177826 RepID=A0ABP9FG04_9GAMM